MLLFSHTRVPHIPPIALLDIITEVIQVRNSLSTRWQKQSQCPNYQCCLLKYISSIL
jgi:hypothetical protein